MTIALTHPAHLIRYAPDGRHLAVVSRGGGSFALQGLVQVYEVGDWQQPRWQLGDAHFPVTCLAWSPDATRLAFGGPAGTVHVWDGASETLVTYAGHSPELEHVPAGCEPQRRAVTALAWSTAEQILSLGRDACLHRWLAATGQTLRRTFRPQTPPGVLFSPDARWLAVFCARTFGFDEEELLLDPAEVVISDTQTQRLVSTFLAPDRLWCGAWSPDASHLALGGWDTLQVWQTSALGQPLLRFATPLPLDAGPLVERDASPHVLAWSPDGTLLACATAWQQARSLLCWEDMAGASSVIELWQVAQGKRVREIPVGSVSCLDWSPDGTHLAVGEADGVVLLPLRSAS